MGHSMMVFRVNALIILMLVNWSVCAQYNIGAKNEAMGSNQVMSQNEWSVYANPAGICEVTRPVLAFDYIHSFVSSEIQTISLATVFPLKSKYYIGFGARRYGIDVYQDSRYTLAYGQRFGLLNLSISQSFHQLAVPHYFQKMGYSLDMGVQYCYSKGVQLGVFWQNIGNLGYVQENGRFPSQCALGIIYDVDENVQVTAALHKPLYVPLSYGGRIGVNYELNRSFCLRGGVISSPFAYYVGFGYGYKYLNVDMAYRQQIILGGQSQITVAYAW